MHTHIIIFEKPPMGIEPTTFRLQSECSTTKLKRHYSI